MERPKGIPENVLDFVGLTPDVFQRFSTEEEAEAQRKRTVLVEQLSKGHNAGMQLYSDATREHQKKTHSEYGYNLRVDIATISPAVPDTAPLTVEFTELQDIPDLLIDVWAHRIVPATDDIDSVIEEKKEQYVKDLVVGIGDKAFDQKDWQTAVNAYDNITEGGVIASEEFQKKLQELSLDRGNYSDRENIAKAIAKRFEDIEMKQRREEAIRQLKAEKEANREQKRQDREARRSTQQPEN